MKNKQFTESEQVILEQIMQLRRDVRGNHFNSQSVDEEVINKIILAATLAPSVGYSQPWEFVIVRDEDIKLKIANVFQVENEKAKTKFGKKQTQYSNLKLEGITEAPVNIAVFYKPSTQPVLGQTSMPKMGEYSVVCAVQNMWLMARAMNVGLGWVSILKPEKVKEVLKVPEENELIAYLCIGYVDEFLSRPELESLKWEEKKDITQAIYFNTYE